MSVALKTRFAASAAPLRIGRARLAVVAWLAARRSGADFVLRLSGDAPPAELGWLGLHADQTQRLADHAPRHGEAAARLRASGRLYPCFESDEELRWKREQRLRRHRSPAYDRAMLKLTEAQRTAAEAGGKRPYWRFLLSDGELGWRDRVAGPQRVKLPALSDPVVVAADGTISAALAAAADDVADGIRLVVRDAGQIEASAVHLDMLAALGGDPGGLALAHLPSLPPAMADLQVRRLRQDGVEPQALATLLARPDATVPLSLAELVAGFELSGSGRLAETVDLDRLRALNRQALAVTPYDAVAGRLPDGAGEAFWLAVRGGIDLLGEARVWWDVIGDGFVPPVLERPVLELSDLPGPPAEPWDGTTWARWTAGIADPAALRLALTGEETGPDMSRLLPLIGRARVERRLRLVA